MVLPDRIELSTSPLPMECSTTELRQHAREQNRPRRPRQAGGSCHKGPSGASTGRVPGPPKSAEIGLSAFFRPAISADSGSIGSISLERRPLCLQRPKLHRIDHLPGRAECDAARPRRVGSARAFAIGLFGLFLATKSPFGLSWHERRSRQAWQANRASGFAAGAAETGTARKSQAAQIAGARSQRCRIGIFRTRGRGTR